MDTTTNVEDFRESEEKSGYYFYSLAREEEGLLICVVEPNGRPISLERPGKVHRLVYQNNELRMESKLGGRFVSYAYADINLVKSLPEELSQDVIDVACEAVERVLKIDRQSIRVNI